MDRISNLPDDILLVIVSSLSAKEAACVKVLSKRLHLDLITIEADLVYDQSNNNIQETFETFVKNAEYKPSPESSDKEPEKKPAEHRIRRLFLKLTNVDDSQYHLINKCLRNVLKRGVMDLEIDINVRNDYSLPVEVFTSKTVVKMKLGRGFVIDNVPTNAFLPALKTLLLDSVMLKQLRASKPNALNVCAFERLLNGSRVLEELIIDVVKYNDWKWSGTVSSKILKKLTFRCKEWYFDDDSQPGAISFDTPSLEYFEIIDVPRNKYPVVKFDSLVEAKLQFRNLFGVKYDFKSLVKELQNVQILSLHDDYTMRRFKDCPEFKNLLHLSVPTQPRSCWKAITNLLAKSPKLKALTIKGSLHYTKKDSEGLDTVCKCLKGYSFLKSLEIVKITKFKGVTGEMVQIGHVLSFPNLELLEVTVAGTLAEKLKIMGDLLMLPRGSTKCRIQVDLS